MKRALLSIEDLGEQPEGSYADTYPPELRAELNRRHDNFAMDRKPEEPYEPLPCVMFRVVEGRGDEEPKGYGLIILESHLYGSVKDNARSLLESVAGELVELTIRRGVQ